MKLHLKYLLCALALVPFSGAGAQEQTATTEVRVAPFGYVSYKDIFERMPEYDEACASFAALKEKFEAEADRSEKEFQRKFAEFLQGQKDFPPTILQKRQAELQDLMDKSVSFRQESQRLLQKAEAEMMQPVMDRLNKAIQEVATERNLIFVINTDDNAVPFINPLVGVNITEPLLLKLGLASPITAKP